MTLYCVGHICIYYPKQVMRSKASLDEDMTYNREMYDSDSSEAHRGKAVRGAAVREKAAVKKACGKRKRKQDEIEEKVVEENPVAVETVAVETVAVEPAASSRTSVAAGNPTKRVRIDKKWMSEENVDIDDIVNHILLSVPSESKSSHTIFSLSEWETAEHIVQMLFKECPSITRSKMDFALHMSYLYDRIVYND